ncbi:unnamed protein product [Somion occarium]|uniref:Uncharacterized protein n=1 Tax=Somion occarium TaxID=3059160 RepID=A0ABP1E005_9APHY
MIVTVATAQLIGAFLYTLGYGVYLVVFPRCLALLRRMEVKGYVLVYLLFTLVGSFITITMHLIADNTCYIIVTIIADALIVYRTFIVWNRSYRVIIIPIVLLAGDIATSIWFDWSHTAGSPADMVIHSPTWASLKYFCALTLALNVLCTCMIAVKIWCIQRDVDMLVFQRGTRRLSKILAIILESAAIYSAFLFAVLGLTIAESGAMFIVLNPIPPVIGIVFAYMIIRSSNTSSRVDMSVALAHQTENNLSRQTTRRTRSLSNNFHSGMDQSSQSDIGTGAESLRKDDLDA